MQTFSPFYTHKFRGKSRPMAPLPKIEAQESSVDVSLLDVMAIEDFLSHLKTKTDNNWKELWKDSCVLAEQLKASRELLSIGSNLLSHKASRKILDRLIEVARVLLSAERVVIMELDVNAQELVVTHSLDEKLLGIRTPLSSGIEGDVVSKCITANISDVHTDPRFVPTLEPKGSNRTKCMVCAPIISDGHAVGAIVAINKVTPAHMKARSPRANDPSPNFSPNEALLLVFIAANVGLALKQSLITKSLTSQVLERHLDIGLAKKLFKKLEGDSSLQKLVELLYSRLDAERVSIFTYSASSKSLICAVSQDIKGISIPQDKGLAGLSFTAMRIINVADARQDSRHFKDVDNSVGFTTRNLLCAPIVTQEGVALGVIQAVNKKSGSSFTVVDEQQMNDVCNMMVTMVKEQAEAKSATNTAEHANSSSISQQQSLALTRAVGKMALVANLGELVVQLENTILPNTEFDLVRVYCVDQDKLVRITPSTYSLKSISADKDLFPMQNKTPDLVDIDPSEVYKISELSVQMKQVLQFGAATEYRYSSESSKLLANLQMQHGIIIPVQAKGYCFHPGNCVVIVGHSSRDDVMTDNNRMVIDTVADIFNSTLASIFERSSYGESFRQLRHQYHVLNSTLGSLEDFVIILNGEGSLLGSNKHVEELLGLQALSSEVLGMSEKRRIPTKVGKSLPTPALDPSTGQICEGMHYTQWLTPANSPELCRDISNALHMCVSRSSDSVRLTSSIYPEGISVDYCVTAIGNPDLVVRDDKNSFLTPSNSKASESSHQGAHPEVDSNNLIVVIIIHINKRKVIEIEEAVPSVTPGKPNTMEVRSASNGVDTATSILGAIRSNYVLDPEMESNIKQIMESLVHTSRKMSISQSNFSAISLAVQAASCMLVNPAIGLPENIFQWEFDVLKIKDSLVLCNIIGKFFETIFDFDTLQIDTTTLARYIAEVGRHYHDRPFHNLQHATCVTHFSFMLIRTSNAIENLKQHQVFGILVSAVVHDVDHPGNTNLFEINSGSELAIRYNDQSVLENHHCSTAFRIMRKPHMQLLSTVSKQIATEIRKTIISCVMATDMAVHFELIDETKKRAVNGWNFDEAKDQALLGKILLHAADLSNPVRPFHMTKEWARRISLEFNDQVEREQALGMPVLGFMMTPDEKAFCKNETGFASFVVAPMWRALVMCYPELNFLVEQLDNNLVTWKGRLEEIQAEEAAAAAAAGELDSTK